MHPKGGIDLHLLHAINRRCNCCRQATNPVHFSPKNIFALHRVKLLPGQAKKVCKILIEW
jgi:hypothetical protein